MKNRMNKILRKQGGFTLLELLIVIVIIGILAVLIVPNLTNGPKRARDAQRKSDLRNIKTALESYFNDNNAYPGSTAALVPTFIKSIPTDPKSGWPAYVYSPNGTLSTYTLTATCENTTDPACSGAGGTYVVQSVN